MACQILSILASILQPFPVEKKIPFDDEGIRRDLNGKKRKVAEPSSSSSPSRTIDKPTFEVFLSLRGKDTRKGFTGHLYNALCQRGISTFIDNEELKRGERIEELFGYIEASKIFVPVLSKGYADSRWCLREITKMVECGRPIIPIFFDVDPTHVQNQSGPFEAAFQRHKSSDKVGEEDMRKWKDALRAVGEISGYILHNDTNGNEAELIQNVVKQISCILNKTARPITEHLVGMDSHIDKMYSLLDLASNEVKMIGIVGMGGVGKTTIASVVYNKLLLDFEDSSFIWNVRENFKQSNGGLALQQKLIKHILKDEHSDIYSIEHGASVIKARLCSKRVLVILDDADHIEQLEALAGKRDWFGSRSRIIITSRDSRVLLNHGVNEEDIYWPELLDDENSLELFISHAFPVVRPTESEYIELAMKFVQVSGRLPLALTVFGSLVRRRNIKQWQEILEKLIQVPNKDVDGKLRISYDGLEENVKQIFLDISCFFIGKEKEYASYMWEDSGLCPETAITELQERSLINVNKQDEFEVHDLLRDMGRGIVAQQGETWQRSRLRNLDDLLKSLAYKDKPRMAEGIVIKGPGETPANYSKTHLSTQDFVNFSCLRLLHLYGFAFEGEFLRLPERLKWLRLENCKLSISALQLIPKWLPGVSNLNAISVLELVQVDDVARILVEQCSVSRKAFDALKVLHIESFLMTRTPEFSKMKLICLRKLTLRNCKMLTKVDGSIGNLKSLVHLDLRDCNELQRLPDSICTLMSLETLILIDCESLSSLPEKLGDMKSLKMLRAENTGIRAIPDSIGDVSNLRTLSLIGNPLLEKLHDSLWRLDSLEELYLDHFEEGLAYRYRTLNLINLDSVLGIDRYTGAFEWLAVIPTSSCEKVKELTIRDDSIQVLPPYLGRLTNLDALSIHCENLKALPQWLGQLQKLKSFELKSDNLEALPATARRTFQNLRSLELNCWKLQHVPNWMGSLGKLEKLLLICHNLRSLPPLPSSLRVLDAGDCNNLRMISDISNLKSLRELILGSCTSLGDFCGLESIAHNLETLELPGPCGGLSGFSQLSHAFMIRVFKEAAFSSLKTFRVSGSRVFRSSYEEEIPFDTDHQPFWISFPKMGRGGKHPTRVGWSSFIASRPHEEQELSISISITEEDGHVVYQCTQDRDDTCTIRGEEIVGYSREGSYLRMQVSASTLNLNEITRLLDEASLIVRYT